MRIIYATFPAGLGGGQLLHTETGVTILADRKYLHAQAVPGKKQGILPSEDFQRALSIELGLEKRGTFPSKIDSPYLDGSLPDYVVQEVEISEAIRRGLEGVVTFCQEHEKPKVLTTEDKPWVLELSSYFPEFRLNREFKEA